MKKTLLFGTVAILFFCSTNIFAQTITLVDDINPDGGYFGSNPDHYVEFNGNIYFSAVGSQELGAELFMYDGTNPPTMVADINPTISFQGPAYLTVFNSKLYFSADDGTNGRELWEYDGTNPPTMVADINTSADQHSSPSYLTVFNGKLYFAADDSTSGDELWVYDGTNAPSMVADVFGYGGSGISYLKVFNGKLYFHARMSPGYQNYELIEYDGVNPPAMVADITAGNSGSYPKYLTVFNNKLYFSAGGSLQNVELWEYDGTNAPSQVADINAGTGSSNPLYITEANNKLYFRATDGVDGDELWEYDGTNPPSQVADIRPGTSGSSPYALMGYNNKLYFRAFDGATGSGLWEYDGTNTPSLVHTVEPQGTVTAGIVFNSKLYFAGKNEVDSTGNELWQHDGTTISMVADIYDRTWGGIPQDLTAFNGKLYFGGNGGHTGIELWEYDGFNSPVMVKDISPGGASFSPFEFTEYKNKLYFRANDGVSGAEMWMYDGVNPPVLMADIYLGSANSNCSGFTVYNNLLYFAATDSLGSELRVYDGINAPSLVAEINTAGSTSPRYLTVFNNKLYFSAADTTNGNALWVYDGTSVSMVVDINALTTTNTTISGLIVYNNKLYFRGDDGINGASLWEYDGTNAPTAFSSTYGAGASYLTVSNNNLYYTAYDATNGVELWAYDGTNPPALVVDINSGSAGSNPQGLIDYDNKVYFWANNGTNIGRELFYYDGTTLTMVPELNVGPNNSSPQNYSKLEVFNNKLYLSATSDYEANDELHVLDNNIVCSMNNTVSVSNLTLTANLTGAGVTYQWIDCDAGTAVAGATSQAFTPTVNGRYAVVVADGSCTDTSSCYPVSVTCAINNAVTQNGAMLTATQLGVAYQWVDCNNNNSIIPGEVSQTFIATANGDYKVIITDGACVDSSSCINVLGVAVTNINSENQLRVYPNPTSNQLTFEWELEGVLEVKELRVIDMTGKVIFTRIPNSNSVDVSQLAKGVYILQLTTTQGIALSRFVKQ